MIDHLLWAVPELEAGCRDGAGVAHPSRDAPGGLRLRRFTLAHPRGGELRRVLEALGLGAAGVEIADGRSAALSAVLETPKGTVELA